MKYIKRPPTYEVKQYTGSEESAEEINDLLQWHGDLSSERIEYSYAHGSANYVKVFKWGSGYYSEKKKEVLVNVGDYLVIREDGKYYSFTEEELKDWFREAE